MPYSFSPPADNHHPPQKKTWGIKALWITAVGCATLYGAWYGAGMMMHRHIIHTLEKAFSARNVSRGTLDNLGLKQNIHLSGFPFGWTFKIKGPAILKIMKQLLPKEQHMQAFSDYMLAQKFSALVNIHFPWTSLFRKAFDVQMINQFQLKDPKWGVDVALNTQQTLKAFRDHRFFMLGHPQDLYEGHISITQAGNTWKALWDKPQSQPHQKLTIFFNDKVVGGFEHQVSANKNPQEKKLTGHVTSLVFRPLHGDFYAPTQGVSKILKTLPFLTGLEKILGPQGIKIEAKSTQTFPAAWTAEKALAGDTAATLPSTLNLQVILGFDTLSWAPLNIRFSATKPDAIEVQFTATFLQIRQIIDRFVSVISTQFASLATMLLQEKERQGVTSFSPTFIFSPTRTPLMDPENLRFTIPLQASQFVEMMAGFFGLVLPEPTPKS